MNTQDAIATLEALQATVRANISGLQGQDGALTVAILQLKDLLNAQLGSVSDEEFDKIPQAVALKEQLAAASDIEVESDIKP